MFSRMILLFLAGCLPVHSQTAGDGEPRLSYRLAENRVYGLLIEIQQETRSESMNSEEVNLYARMNLRFALDSIHENGNLGMQAEYTGLKLSLLAPGMGLDINSDATRNPLLAARMEQLQEKPFRVVMRPSGELVSLDGLAAIFRELEPVPAADSIQGRVILNTLDEVYGPRAFRGYFQLFVSYFPVVQPIRNWTREITYYLNTKPVRLVNRYQLSRSTPDRLIIQGMGMLESESAFRETLPVGEVNSTVSGTQTYDYQVDRETGWLRSCTSRQRVLIETKILQSKRFPEGLTLPSYTETLFEVKGTLPEP